MNIASKITQEITHLIAFGFVLFIVLSGALGRGFAQDTNLLDSTGLTDSFAAAESVGVPTKYRPELRGEHTLSVAVPISGGSFDDSLTGEIAPVLKNSVKLSFDWGHGLALVAGLELRSTLQQAASGVELQHQLRPAEIYASLYDLDGISSLYLGWLNFSWGAADKISPIDILNPRDLNLSPRQQEKLAVLGVRFQLQPLSWLGLESVYLPFYQSEQLDILAALDGKLPAGGKVVLDKTALDFSEPTLGGRLRFYLPNFDIGLSYLFAPDAALSPVPELIFSPAAKIYRLQTLRLKRRQLHHWGLDLRLALPQWSLWLDTTFTVNMAWQPGSYAVRSPKLSGVFGAEIYYGPAQKFYSNLQYSLRWLPDYRLNNPDAHNLQGANNTESAWQNYYLSQFSDDLAGYQQGLLQRFILHMAFPLELSSGFSAGNSGAKAAFNLNPKLNLAYEFSLLGKGDQDGAQQIYVNPELELNWDWQTSADHSLRLSLALGLEWFVRLDNASSTIVSGPYKDQIYCELRLLW